MPGMRRASSSSASRRPVSRWMSKPAMTAANSIWVASSMTCGTPRVRLRARSAMKAPDWRPPHERRAAPPAHRAENENQQPGKCNNCREHARGAALVARVAQPILSELDDAARVVGRGGDDIAPEVWIEHVRRTAQQRLRIGG